jgi:hypothetical protein
MSLGEWKVLAGSTGCTCIHTALLPDNRLLCFERPHELPYPANPNTGGVTATELQIVTDGDTWRVVNTLRPLPENPFCAGHAMLENGEILVVGGDMRAVPTNNLVDGRRSIRKYTPCKTGSGCQGNWSTEYSMSTGRW